MNFIIDTHALIWFFENNPRLGKHALNAFENPEATLWLHVIVLCELLFYLRKKRKSDEYDPLIRVIQSDKRIQIVDLNLDQISKIPSGLEMHDGLIAALALQIPEAKILTCDRLLTSWASHRIAWG